MKVKLNQPRATDKGPEQIGDEIDVPDDEGRRMIAKGQAKEVKSETKQRQ